MSTPSNQDFFGELQDVKLISAADGKEILATDLWKEQKTVLRMFRRLGWQQCRAEAVLFDPILPILKENNIRVIGIGTDYGAEEFYKTGVWKSEFYISKNYEIYKRIPGIKKVALMGLGGLVHIKKINENIKVIKAALGEEAYNKIPGNYKGSDPFYGGTFICGPGNVLTFSHFDQFSLDWTPNSEILKACGIDTSNLKNIDTKVEETNPTN